MELRESSLCILVHNACKQANLVHILSGLWTAHSNAGAEAGAAASPLPSEFVSRAVCVVPQCAQGDQENPVRRSRFRADIMLEPIILDLGSSWLFRLL